MPLEGKWFSHLLPVAYKSACPCRSESMPPLPCTHYYDMDIELDDMFNTQKDKTMKGYGAYAWYVHMMSQRNTHGWNGNSQQRIRNWEFLRGASGLNTCPLHNWQWNTRILSKIRMGGLPIWQGVPNINRFLNSRSQNSRHISTWVDFKNLKGGLSLTLTVSSYITNFWSIWYSKLKCFKMLFICPKQHAID